MVSKEQYAHLFVFPIGFKGLYSLVLTCLSLLYTLSLLYMSDSYFSKKIYITPSKFKLF